LSAHGHGGATLLILVLALLTGCLHQGPESQWTIHQETPAESWDALFAAAAPEDLFDDAVQRRLHGDLVGAADRLLWLRLHGDDSPATLYQLGVVYELDERFDDALGVYDLLLAELRDSELSHDVRFRRGLTLEALGYPKAALRDYHRIPSNRDWDRSDRYTLDLVKGAVLLTLDREREGRTLVLGALKATEDTGEVPWARGRALFALANHSLRQGSAIPLKGGQERLARQIRLRLEAIERADNYLVHVVKTQEPEWILAGLLALGDAWLALHDDLAAAPVPRGLSRWQQEHYLQLLAQQLTRFRTRAWNVYDQGLGVSGTYQVENRYTGWLRQRRDGIVLAP